MSDCVCVFVRFCLSSNTHICILYMSEKKKNLRSIRAAVTVFCRQAKTRRRRVVGAGGSVVEVVLSVYVTQTKYNSLQMQPRSLFHTEVL